MACDEILYRQYLDGDDAGLDALMKEYGDPLTMYIDGYLHDVHEAEELMLDVFAYLFTKKPRIRDGGLKTYLYKAARRLNPCNPVVGSMMVRPVDHLIIWRNKKNAKRFKAEVSKYGLSFK